MFTHSKEWILFLCILFLSPSFVPLVWMWPQSRQPEENMVKFVPKSGKSLKSFYLVVDKNNFDDNNNKRNKGDHHHRNQDANIIYKSLK